jgi:hypothetical protein
MTIIRVQEGDKCSCGCGEIRWVLLLIKKRKGIKVVGIFQIISHTSTNADIVAATFEN